MKFGITDFYGYNENYKLRLERIKNAGFTNVMMSDDKKYRKINGVLSKRVKYAKKLGLELSSLHASYDNNVLKNIVHDNKQAKRMEKNLKREIKLASKYGFKNLVVHLKGENTKEILSRIERLLVVANKYDVNLAIENLSEINVFKHIHKNIKNVNLKFCYDCGHNNCFTPKEKFFPKYAKLLTCVHLHDNDGTNDQHIPFGLGGNINLDTLAESLSQTDLQVLDFEILPKIKTYDNPDDLLAQTIKNAKELAKMIELKRNK